MAAITEPTYKNYLMYINKRELQYKKYIDTSWSYEPHKNKRVKEKSREEHLEWEVKTLRSLNHLLQDKLEENEGRLRERDIELAHAREQVEASEEQIEAQDRALEKQNCELATRTVEMSRMQQELEALRQLARLWDTAPEQSARVLEL